MNKTEIRRLQNMAQGLEEVHQPEILIRCWQIIELCKDAYRARHYRKEAQNYRKMLIRAKHQLLFETSPTVLIGEIDECLKKEVKFYGKSKIKK